MLLIRATLPTQITEIVDRPCRDLRYNDVMTLENVQAQHQEAPPVREQAPERSVTLEQLLEQALALNTKDRETLVVALQTSLDAEASDADNIDDAESLGPEAQAQWDAEWGAEIRRRVDDFHAGRTKLHSHEEVMAVLRSRLSSP
ncbi:MAG TPA: addiction module protein [Kofleriaceae bacterium]|jgi:putative addiction module component (TIGR02574 family)|nr:addiction module protein [Kofleriaceae bacterium]